MSAYLDSETRTQLRVRIDRHTAECPECRAVLSELRRMLDWLKAMPEPAVDGPAITSAVMRRLYEPAAD
jgi:anti-sigma factor RsiW